MSYSYSIDVVLRGDRAALEAVYSQGLIYRTEATTGPIASVSFEEDCLSAHISAYCRYADLDAWEALANETGLRLDCRICCPEKCLTYATDPALFGEVKYHVLLRLGDAARARLKTDYIRGEGQTVEALLQNINAAYGTAFESIEALHAFYENECYPEPTDDMCQLDPPSFWCWKDPCGGDDEVTRKYFF